MSFSFFESSRSKGAPHNLYFFKVGPEALDYYAYTDAEKAVTFEGVEYNPIPIERDAVISNGTLDQTTLSVRVPYNNPVAELFKVAPPEHQVTLIVYAGHADDPDNEFRAIWNGRIQGSGLNGYEAEFTGEPITTQRRRAGLRRFYQYGCPHVLYQQGPGKCNANKTQATVSATVQAVSGATVTLPLGWYSANLVSRFNNGLLEIPQGNGAPVSRTILQVQNDRELILNASAAGLAPGDRVDVIFGCGHDMASCRDLHRNIQNFGGCPWIPTQNPIGNVNNFY